MLRRRSLVPIVVALGIAAAGCGDDGDAGGVDVFLDAAVFSTRPVGTAAPAESAGTATAGGDGETRTPNTQNYVIQSGDSVYGIAEEFDVSPDALVEVNSWENENEQLLVGDSILIPPNGILGGSSSSSSDADSADSDSDDSDASDTTEADADSDSDDSSGGAGVCEDGSDAETYEIQGGDNPSKVAEANDVSLADLQAINEGNSAINSFIVGEEIFLPC